MTKYFALSIIFLLSLSLVQSTVHFADNTNTYPTTICPTPNGAKAFSATRLNANSPTLTAAASIPQIDALSYVDDGSVDDVIEIRVAITGTANPWTLTFTSTSSTLGTPKVSVGTSTSTARPIILNFLGNVLLTNEDGVYKAYVVEVTGDHPTMFSILHIDPPTTAYPLATSFTQFRVVSVSSDSNPIITVYVEGATSAPGTYADFIDFTIVPNNPSISNAKTNAAYGGWASKVALKANLAGGSGLYLDRGAGGVKQFTSSGTEQYQSLSSSAAPVFNAATDDVTYYKLHGNNVVLLLIQHVNKRQATVVSGTAFATITASKSISTTTSTAVVKYYSDNLQNLLVLTDQALYWINSHGAIIKADIAQAAGFTGNDLKIYTTNHVSLSGNKAFALYSTEIVAFQIISSSVVNLYKTIAFTGADVPGASGAIDVKFTINCQCSAVKVKRFTCFSSSLNCQATADASWSVANC